MWNWTHSYFRRWHKAKSLVPFSSSDSSSPYSPLGGAAGALFPKTVIGKKKRKTWTFLWSSAHKWNLSLWLLSSSPPVLSLIFAWLCAETAAVENKKKTRGSKNNLQKEGGGCVCVWRGGGGLCSPGSRIDRWVVLGPHFGNPQPPAPSRRRVGRTSHPSCSKVAPVTVAWEEKSPNEPWTPRNPPPDRCAGWRDR